MKFTYFFAISLLSLLVSTGAFSQESNLKEDYSAYLPEVRAFNQVVSKLPAQTLLTKEGLANARVGLLKTMQRLMPSPPVLKPTETFVKGPGGTIRVVVVKPALIRAVVLNIHGGGWSVGSPEGDAQFNDELARACQVAVVSPDYRLVPEHPFPAPVDDCQAVAKWLVENAKKEFGTDQIVISGGSAGAHLAALTTLYIRDSLNAIAKVKGVNLIYGVYDLNRTPSNRQATDSSYLSKTSLNETFQLAFKGWNAAQLQNPAYSPLYADLTGLPPALFAIGLTDTLVDDTYFMESRWRNAGNQTYLAVYPECPHSFNVFPTKLAKVANQRMFDWITNRLQQPASQTK